MRLKLENGRLDAYVVDHTPYLRVQGDSNLIRWKAFHLLYDGKVLDMT